MRVCSDMTRKPQASHAGAHHHSFEKHRANWSDALCKLLGLLHCDAYCFGCCCLGCWSSAFCLCCSNQACVLSTSCGECTSEMSSCQLTFAWIDDSLNLKDPSLILHLVFEITCLIFVLDSFVSLPWILTLVVSFLVGCSQSVDFVLSCLALTVDELGGDLKVLEFPYLSLESCDLYLIWWHCLPLAAIKR